MLHVCISYSLLHAVAGLRQTLVIQKLQALSLFTGLFVFATESPVVHFYLKESSVVASFAAQTSQTPLVLVIYDLFLVDFLSVVTIFT